MSGLGFRYTKARNITGFDKPEQPVSKHAIARAQRKAAKLRKQARFAEKMRKREAKK